MKVIIAGCRDWEASRGRIDEAVEASGFDVTELVCGMATGIDTSGRLWAEYEGIPIKPFPYLKQYGRAGGPIRNAQMAEYADALIAFWDGKSKGTLNMINCMRALKKPYFLQPLGSVRQGARKGVGAHMKRPMLAIDCETTGLAWYRDRLHGLGVALRTASEVSGGAYHRAGHIPPEVIADLADPNVDKLGHNIAFDIRFLRAQGLEVRGRFYDTRIMAHLLDENQPCGLKELALRYLGPSSLSDKSELDRAISLAKVKHVGELAALDLDDPEHPWGATIARYCLEDCRNTLDLFEILKEKLKENAASVRRIWPRQRTPLDYLKEEALPFLAAQVNIEQHGIRVDPAAIEQRKAELRDELKHWETELRDVAPADALSRVEDHFQALAVEKKLAGYKTEKARQRLLASPEQCRPEFSWNSLQHMTRLLFNELSVPAKLAGRTPKGAISLDDLSVADMKAALPAGHAAKPVLDAYAEYKGTAKLLNTYIGDGKKGFTSYVHEEIVMAPTFDVTPMTVHRVFPTYSPFLVTGRLSAVDPPIQTLPRGSGIKKFFRPHREDAIFVHADASQVELRIAAHLSQDEHFLAAYNDGLDLHKNTASAMFDVPMEGISPEQRQAGKSTNFLLIYKGGPGRLQEQLKTQAGLFFDIEECKAFRAAFFEKYKGYAAYLDRQKKFAERYGIVISEAGRIRRLPDIKLGAFINRRQRYFQGPQKLRDELLARPGERVHGDDGQEVYERACRYFAHAEKQAYNFPVQSLGASITKRAIVKLLQRGYNVRCTVHDSVDIELPVSRLYAVEEIKEILETSYRLSVPVVWDVKLLKSFDEKDVYELPPSK